MAFRDYPELAEGVRFLQRSLERGRLPHACLFAGDDLESLEKLTRTLAKTLSCQQAVLKSGESVDCCDQCPACARIEAGRHSDVHWVRPESKSRVITIDQMRDLLREVHLKPGESRYKVCAVIAADRMNDRAANAFLKTLEEPPPRSILVLVTTEPQRMLETIMSRCQRLNFGAGGLRRFDGTPREWLADFSRIASGGRQGLLARYRLMDVLLKVLSERKAAIESDLTARSPLNRYEEVEKDLADKWEDELKAAIEAEYRRQRSNLLGLLQWWLRDVWLCAMGPGLADGGGSGSPLETGTGGVKVGLLSFPELAETRQLAARVTARDAMANLQVLEQAQRWLHTNVQEALALEVCLLKLRL